MINKPTILSRSAKARVLCSHVGSEVAVCARGSTQPFSFCLCFADRPWWCPLFRALPSTTVVFFSPCLGQSNSNWRDLFVRLQKSRFSLVLCSEYSLFRVTVLFFMMIDSFVILTKLKIDELKALSYLRLLIDRLQPKPSPFHVWKKAIWGKWDPS